nr:hypothetical protein 10 [bacterium]
MANIDLHQIKQGSELDPDNPAFGVYQMPNEDYHAAAGLSASRLKAAAKSGAHFKDHGLEPNPSIRKGTVLHAAALEPEEFNRIYAELPSRPMNTKDGVIANLEELYQLLDQPADFSALKNLNINDLRGQFRSLEAQANANGIIWLRPAEREAVDAMAHSIRRHPTAGPILRSKGALSELSFFTPWPIGGEYVTVKVRPDMLVPMAGGGWLLVSLKTCDDASPDAFCNKSARLGYHLAEGFYREVLREAFGLNIRDVVVIAQENKKPYICEVYRADEEFLDYGWAAASKALERAAAFQADPDRYDGYTEAGEIMPLYLPYFFKRQQDNENEQ